MRFSVKENPPHKVDIENNQKSVHGVTKDSKSSDVVLINHQVRKY